MRLGWLVLSVLALTACTKGEETPTAAPATSAAPAVPATNPAPGAAATAPSAAATAPSAAAAAAAAPGKHLGSCSIAGVACSDYYGAADVAPVKSACQSVGKWSDGPCPGAGVGTCTKTEPGGILNKAHTYPPGTPATAKQACDNTPGGVFSGG